MHRIGQNRPVTVTRLLVKDTVEEHVLSVQSSRQALFEEQRGGGDAGGDDDITAVAQAVAREEVGVEVAEELLEAALRA